MQAQPRSLGYQVTSMAKAVLMGSILALAPVGVLTTAIAPAVAEAATPAAAEQEAAQTLRSKLQALPGFSADFKQVVTNVQEEVLSQSEGRIYLQHPDRFMMHTTSPDELALYTYQGDIYYYDAAVNQVSIFALDRSLSNPLLLLTSKDESLWNEYRVAQSDNRFTLIPREVQDIRSVTIAFAEGEHTNEQGQSYQLLESLTIRMDDGNSNFYLFSQQQGSAQDSDFDFALPDDVEMDDMR